MALTSHSTAAPFLSAYEFGPDYAKRMDAADPLKHFRDQFFFPKHHDGSDITYFCGNSLGLQPKGTAALLEREMVRWRDLAVEGHFKVTDPSHTPWMHFHQASQESFARIVGALPSEVIAMNNLTVNLHLMMVSFYKPSGKKCKLVVEAGAFPSDQYAFETQARFHGLDPDEVIIELTPRIGEKLLRTEDILQTIHDHQDEICLILLGGINYYTGQVYDMAAITKAGHAIGAKVGFDLAHAAGNIPVKLHDWDVDFAVWCTYKYINSGPGAVAGAFVHERHHQDNSLDRFAGWWGYDDSRRFLMEKGFVPMQGAAGWQLSNTNVLTHAALHASLALFDQTSMEALREKSLHLTGYLAYLIGQVTAIRIEILTPLDARGAQLSLITHEGKKLFYYLCEQGIIGDWREPDVIRIAPTPLYNNYSDVWKLFQAFQNYQG